MKLNLIKRFIVLILMTYCCGQMVAQQANTLYFMQGVSERSIYNPAFQAPYDLYIDLPVLPNFGLSIGNNSLALSDVIFNKKNDKGKNLHFLTPEAYTMGKRKDFFDALYGTTRINTDFSLNLLGFGFRGKNKKNFYTFDITLKEEAGVYLPKDIFGLMLNGTSYKDKFNLNKFGVNASVYTEVAFGMSHKVNDQWTIGGKLKYLIGLVNISTDIKKLELAPSIEKWAFQGEGSLNASIPEALVEWQFKDGNKVDWDKLDSKIDDFEVKDLKVGDFFKNFGFGADLGVTYKVLPQLQLSAAVIDLGFIRWSNNTLNTRISKEPYVIDGITYKVGDEWEETIGKDGLPREGLKKKFEDEFDGLKDLFENSHPEAKEGDPYTTLLSSRLNVGAEYSVANDKIAFGLLSSTLYANKALFPDLTASVNFRPCNWFQPTISYSVLDAFNTHYRSIGAGVQLKLAMFNMYLAIDKIPVGKKSIVEVCGDPLIPQHLTGTNLYAGMTWVFGPTKKKCFNVPKTWIVDKYGCPIDSDGDGVPDSIDECPNTPAGVEVDSRGCPFDSDGDGVPDYLDECPNTPAGVAVDSKGCPFDTDGDGVPDYLDKCPGTPVEAYGKIDAHGCPLDTDGDGVPDYLDECPNTPAGVQVDSKGCPIDTDGDGIPDYLDRCPNVPGPASNDGCPELKATEKATFEKAMHGIKFATGSAVITKASYPILDAIVMIMNENPSYLLIINGHTDNVGKPAYNQVLSEKRAASVRDYIVKKGIKADRILKAQGFGDTQPVVPNTTAANKAQNRRVEFIVKYEKEVEK